MGRATSQRYLKNQDITKASLQAALKYPNTLATFGDPSLYFSAKSKINGIILAVASVVPQYCAVRLCSGVNDDNVCTTIDSSCSQSISIGFLILQLMCCLKGSRKLLLFPLIIKNIGQFATSGKALGGNCSPW